MKTLHITKQNFLDWYFEEDYTEESRSIRESLAQSIIDQMYKVGFGSMSVQELFDNCNQQAIKLYCTEEYLMQTDEFDIEISELEGEFQVILID